MFEGPSNEIPPLSVESVEPTEEQIEKVVALFEQENENETESGGLKEWFEKNKGRLKSYFRKVVIGAMLSGPLLAVGCNKSESAPENSGDAGTKAESVEGEKITEEEENKAYERAFQLACGDRIGTMENGKLVAHLGGSDYYEVTDAVIEKVTDISRDYATRIKRQEKGSNGTFSLVLDRVLELKTKVAIAKFGNKVSFENLPDNLKESEKARQEMVKDMESATQNQEGNEQGPTGQVTPDSDL